MTKAFSLSSGLLFLVFVLCPFWAEAQTLSSDAQLSQVKGNVRVLNVSGKSKKAHKGDTVVEGDTIQSGLKGSAQITIFDGSTLDVSPSTRLVLKSLKNISSKEKKISLSLGLGKVLAQVRKLMSSNSSFEVEAGGVVCGVRGTEFSVGFDPAANHVDVDVFGGTVGVASGGVTQLFTGGQSGNFVGGKWDGKINPAPPPPKPGTGSSTTGGTGTGGNGTGSNGTGSNGTGSNGAPNNGTPNNGTPDNGTPNNGTPDNGTPDNGAGTTGASGGGSLGDLNDQFVGGVVVNGDNNLNSAQQNLHIHLVVP